MILGSARGNLMRLSSRLILVTIALTAFAGAARGGGGAHPYDVRAAFKEADTNGDGEVDLAEFHDRILEVFYNADTDKNGLLSPDEYARLPFSGDFKDADPHGSGSITLHEFIAVRYRQFVIVDSNHDGALSLQEVVDAYGEETR
jgi:EF hand domain-containing protein